MITDEDTKNFIKTMKKHFPDADSFMVFRELVTGDGEEENISVLMSHPFVKELVGLGVFTGDFDIDELLLIEIEVAIKGMKDAN